VVSEGHVETAMVEQLSTVYTEDGEEIFWFWFDISRDASTEILFLFWRISLDTSAEISIWVSVVPSPLQSRG